MKIQMLLTNRVNDLIPPPSLPPSSPSLMPDSTHSALNYCEGSSGHQVSRVEYLPFPFEHKDTLQARPSTLRQSHGPATTPNLMENFHKMYRRLCE